MEWISVDDRLPDNEDDVLVVTRSKSGVRNIDKGYYTPLANRWAHRGTAEVTHWQPLPELLQLRGTPIDKLLDDLEAFAAVNRWRLFDREIAIIREEIKRRLDDESCVEDSDANDGNESVDFIEWYLEKVEQNAER